MRIKRGRRLSIRVAWENLCNSPRGRPPWLVTMLRLLDRLYDTSVITLHARSVDIFTVAGD